MTPLFWENIQGLLELIGMDTCLSSLGQAAPKPVLSQPAAVGCFEHMRGLPGQLPGGNSGQCGRSRLEPLSPSVGIFGLCQVLHQYRCSLSSVPAIQTSPAM